MLVRERETGHRGPDRRGVLLPVLAVIGVGALVVGVSRLGLLNLPDWLDGGKSDPAPRGEVIYEGQEAQSASENFLIDIGDGEAVVAVRAKQNWDTPGWWINGDFQSTNGTSSVADPDDRDVPARLRVKMDYCAEGTITTTTPADGDGPESVTFDMSEIFVCGSQLEHTPDNDAAFKQDDTPNRFHGDFVSFVSGAVETTAAAAECPTDELARFREGEYTAYVRSQLADRFGVPEDAVEVRSGRVGSSDDETKQGLRDALESYANKQDPDDPSRTYESLSIDYLSSTGEAVEDSCWKEPGGTDLDNLDDVDAPEPQDR